MNECKLGRKLFTIQKKNQSIGYKKNACLTVVNKILILTFNG